MAELDSKLSYSVPAQLHLVAANLMRWLNGPRPTSWGRSAGWYLRVLGLVYLTAFVSLWVQIHGLIGSHGILPIQQFLSSLRGQVDHPCWQVPTLCWVDDSDGFLTFQCAAGAGLAVLATLGIGQVLAFAMVWLLYLSLTNAGQVFLGYQWDGLLLEAGLLAIFLSPMQWLTWKPRWAQPPIVMMWLQRWLVFRLMFLSGVVKLASGDPTWRNLTALTYHYWTQPIPTWTSYYAAHWPLWFQKVSTVGMFVVEVGLPLLMFGPRLLRTIAAIGVVGLQLLILATGNFGFFNLLAIALCIPLLDDSMLPGLWPRSADTAPPANECPRLETARLWVTGMLGLLLVIATGTEFARRCGFGTSVPSPCQFIADTISPLRSTNSYGLFAVMTTDRNELIFEGSNDRMNWTEYRFKWKPGDVKRRPSFCNPHMPRLDWQLWFAALDPQGNMPVIEGMVREILQGSKPVMALLDGDPFAGRPPKYVRVKIYQYRFTTSLEGAQSGDWWVRTYTGRQTEPYSLGSASQFDSSQ